MNGAASSPEHSVKPGVSDDQTGMSSNQINPGVSDNQTGMSSNRVKPEVSDDQTGTVHLKRAEVVSADPEDVIPLIRPRGPENFDAITEENEVETVVIDDDFASPNSRWQASEKLSTFVGTTHKRMNKLERKTLV